MKIYRYFSFWLLILSISICLFNLLGFDDKNLLMFLTSPPFWLIETHWFVVNFTHPSDIPMSVIYVLTVLFWFLLGLILDKALRKLKNK
ncbi:hypothetical protein [Cytobacillus firmus]|jgi:hypothetical protein|uniref:hypothetical protein n=1 Tax=Cytobacillus firmus TaxID=1399 RepID=UPI001C8D5291|nr:hypothetical protein [Cytobacillus firmus]MBX9974087.1 hypothetical protein [Cytobacillus firmus]